ncbi:MAG: DUF4249 domain-containing protein [Bacteroidota bacterium]
MKISVYIILLFFLFISCEQEIDLALNEPDNRLVVEARLELPINVKTTDQFVKLTRINNYFDNDASTGVTDASVNLTDERGIEHPYFLVEGKEGVYKLSGFIPKRGGKYILNIYWNDAHYQASETVVDVPSIDSVYQIFEAENTFEDGGLKLAIDFTDPEGQSNFYFWELYVNNENILRVDSGNSNNVVASDDLFNGQTIRGYFPNEERVFEPGEEVMVKQIGLSEAAFDFYFQIFEQTGQTGSFIDVPPSKINGNIVNLTDNENYALGYFSASQTDTKLYVIQDDVER